MLVSCATLIGLLICSAAFLHGIYGGVGQVGVALAIIAALLCFQFLGLVPLIQLVRLRSGRLTATAHSEDPRT